MKTGSFNQTIAFRVLEEDASELSKVARAWQMDESEIARRALRLGLERLSKVEIPGNARAV